MKPFRIYLFALACAPAFSQTPSPFSQTPSQYNAQLDDLKERLLSASQMIAQANLHVKPGVFDRSGFDYDRGMNALDNRKYEDAVRSFDSVIAAKTPRAEGALYWKAYALNRLGRRDDALAAIATLRRDYPKSRWLNEAQALEVEVRQSSGKPVSPADESNEDLKLIAINGLINADPERAVPMLENVLKGAAAPTVKDRALFVLSQSPSPRAQQLLADYAKGSGNPDLQIRALRYLGMAGTPEKQQLLVSVYSGTTDVNVKTAVIRALFIAGAAGKLVDLARKERDPQMKVDIVRQLSLMGNKEATDYMMEILK